jgi:hypothetical protein
MLRVLCLLVIPFLSFNTQAHSPYSEILYEYYDYTGGIFIAERFYVDGLVAKDPSKFRVKNKNSKILYETDHYVRDMVVVKISNKKHIIYEFDSLLIPFASRILIFNGKSFIDNYSKKIFFNSLFVRVWYQKINYLSFIIFAIGMFSLILKIRSKKTKNWMKNFIITILSPVIVLLPFYMLVFPLNSSLNPLLLMFLFITLYVLMKNIQYPYKKELVVISFDYIIPFGVLGLLLIYYSKLILFIINVVMAL